MQELIRYKDIEFYSRSKNGLPFVYSVFSILRKCFLSSLDVLNKTKDWALVQNAALIGVEFSLG